jgi:hypothetical protein
MSSKRISWISSATVFAAALVGVAAVTAQTRGSDAHGILSTWPAKPQEVGRQMIEKYGQPDEITASMMVWNGKGPWKRTILYRDEVPHSFPMKHTDLLEQFVDYRVPPEKFDELARYDGSVIVERTKGEISARCDKEEMNFLALNLSDDIVKGKRTVEAARAFYAKTAMAFKEGKKDPYTQGLRFSPAKAGAADPDREMPMKMK